MLVKSTFLEKNPDHVVEEEEEEMMGFLDFLCEEWKKILHSQVQEKSQI